MIDYRYLHSKIKEVLKWDTQLRHPFILEQLNTGDGLRAIREHQESGYIRDSYNFYPSESAKNRLECLAWFATALNIPLHDNPYTELLKASKLLTESTDGDDQVVYFACVKNDIEIIESQSI